MLTNLVQFCVKEAPLVVLLSIGLVALGWTSYQAIPIDAIPNIGENQVIVLTPWPGRSPKDIEDQVTYPLSVSLLAVPGAESVRGKSMFGYSFVQVTFKDSVDFYWARSRVAELLGSAAAQLPAGVTPQLGPDATALGQVFYYVLMPPPAGKSLAELRSLQDFVVKYELQAVEGVSEVASIGGYVRQYQIEVDPGKLRFHNVTLDRLMRAVRGSNVDVGAKTIESTGMEFIVRGKGYLGSGGDTAKAIRDIEETVIDQREGVPLRIQDVARVELGPDFRRGALDYNGGEAVGGVVVMRYGENARLVAHVAFATSGRVGDLESVAAIEKSLREAQALPKSDPDQLSLPAGYSLETVGSFRNQIEANQRLVWMVPLVILINLLIIYLQFRDWPLTFAVFAGIPVAFGGGMIMLAVYGTEMNTAIWVGFIALFGIAVDDGVVIATYLDQVFRRRKLTSAADIRAATIEAGMRRIRPCLMTTATTVLALVPVLVSTGRGADVARAMALPVFGGMIVELVTLFVVPVVFCGYKEFKMKMGLGDRHWEGAELAHGISGIVSAVEE